MIRGYESLKSNFQPLHPEVHAQKTTNPYVHTIKTYYETFKRHESALLYAVREKESLPMQIIRINSLL